MNALEFIEILPPPGDDEHEYQAVYYLLKRSIVPVLNERDQLLALRNALDSVMLKAGTILQSLDNVLSNLHLKVKDAPVGSIIEMIDHDGKTGVNSGRYYKISAESNVIGSVTAYTRFERVKVRLYPHNLCRVVSNDEELEGFN